MTQEVISANGFSARIDHCLRGASLNGDHFRYAIRAASMERLRRLLMEFDSRPNWASFNKARVRRMRERLAKLEKMNSQLEARGIA